jgi:hypothetical protein
MKEIKAMKAIRVFDLAFPPTRMLRSRAYKAGVLDTLLKQLDGVPDLPNPYQLGSAECDAYLAGEDEGSRLAGELMGVAA